MADFPLVVARGERLLRTSTLLLSGAALACAAPAQGFGLRTHLYVNNYAGGVFDIGEDRTKRIELRHLGTTVIC